MAPNPRFSVNKSVKLKKTKVKKSKENGAIVREPTSPSRRAAQEVSDSQTVSDTDSKKCDPKNSDKTKVVKNVTISENTKTKTIALTRARTTAVNKGKQLLLDDIKSHSLLMTKLSQFTKKELITRSEIVTITDIVGIYTELNDVELKLVRDFKEFLEAANVTEEQAESSC